jgi:alpha-ketoglutarate-dependent 2,4-dichlorophenoxyacetate dioxygenase
VLPEPQSITDAMALYYSTEGECGFDFQGSRVRRRIRHNTSGVTWTKIEHQHQRDGGERYMSLSVRRIPASFAAEILGADLHREPTHSLIDAVNTAVAEYAVIVLRDQVITDEEQVRFSRAFGPLELPPQIRLTGPFKRRLGPELYDVSNLNEHGDFLPPESLQLASNRANEEFHTDSSFNALPTKWSLLSARILPPFGADTLFVDTRAVYDALPKELKERAQDAVAEHYFWKTRGRAGFGVITDEMRVAMPAVPHPVVRIVPESGRRALYIGNHATHIVGWPRAEGERFLDQLNAFAAQPGFIYTHRWRPGDFVIWDNRCTVHRATPYDVFKYKRDLRRTTINEYGPETSSTAAVINPRASTNGAL